LLCADEVRLRVDTLDDELDALAGLCASFPPHADRATNITILVALSTIFFPYTDDFLGSDLMPFYWFYQ
ncbi:hypothetical protein, partial [Lactiplantibacillus plantarum]|uniref:hypothetical protein n=1 Tax=Lactiplantibacillus plantarum TaxID=1590 RepID=UPI003C250D60